MKHLTNIHNITHSSFLCADGCIVYKIIRKPIRNAYLHYDTKDNIFYVTCSKWFSIKQIDEFVKANYKKLIDRYKQHEQLQDYQLFGNHLTIVYEHSNKNYCLLNNNVLTVYCKSNNSTKKIIRSYMYEIAISYLIPRTKQLLTVVNKSVDNIDIKWFGNRWGSYFKSKNEIALSAQLIKFDKNVIDEVIWHEIAHITYYDHSPNFHKLLKQYCPEYKKLEKQLNHYFDF